MGGRRRGDRHGRRQGGRFDVTAYLVHRVWTAVRRRRVRLLGRWVRVLGGLLLPLMLAACLTSGSDQHNAPGVNIMTRSGVDIADLRVASFQAAPYPVGSDVQVLARMVAKGPGDRLTGASSSAAESAVLIGPDGAPASALVVPPDGVLALTPDGPHVVLRGLRQVLREGDWIPITLTFERAGEIRTDIPRRVDTDAEYTRSPADSVRTASGTGSPTQTSPS